VSVDSFMATVGSRNGKCVEVISFRCVWRRRGPFLGCSTARSSTFDSECGVIPSFPEIDCSASDALNYYPPYRIKWVLTYTDGCQVTAENEEIKEVGLGPHVESP
jgi:hypothetical protein